MVSVFLMTPETAGIAVVLSFAYTEKCCPGSDGIDHMVSLPVLIRTDRVTLGT